MNTTKKAVKNTATKKATKSAQPKKAAKVEVKNSPKVVTSKNVSKNTTSSVKPEKISRTKIIEMINSIRGKYFTTTHIDKENNPRTMRCIQRSGAGRTELGYISVWVPKENGIRNINPQTITHFTHPDGREFKAKK